MFLTNWLYGGQLCGRNRNLRQRGSFETLEARQYLTTIVFDDSLQSPWQDWSWGATNDFSNTSPVSEGSSSIAVALDEGWAGFYLAVVEPISSLEFDTLTFTINGGVGGQTVKLHVADGTGHWLDAGTYTLPSESWSDITVSFQDLGNPASISGLIWQEYSGTAQDTFYLDEILFLDDEADGGEGDPSPGPSITIDAGEERGTISEQIYGLNFAEETFAEEINLPVNRWGGNSTTRYNYQIDAFNTASDWFFENIPNEVDDADLLPNGSAADNFVQQNINVGADTIMTVGTIGWTPKSREIVGGFDVNKYGAQQEVDPWRPQYGNGVALDGSFITGNDPTDTSLPVDEEFAQDWIRHLIDQFGSADEGGVQYYALDNEPMLWNYTHRDVHPEPASYDEVLEKGIRYASAIKELDPSSQVLGPTVWGWTAYFYSALDAAGEGAWWENPLDQNAHGGQDFIPWYLSEMHAAEQQMGTRLLDYLDIHYYPQTEGVALSSAGDADTQRDRLLSTRSLWDPTYVDDSWINEPVRLIPRMRDWIDAHYPDTQLAITEYSFGANEHINGAITQADVLGIFGREGVDLATLWAPPSPEEPVAYAFRMFRNYDGQQQDGSRFGDTSVAADTSDVDRVSVFAATRDTDNALTVVLVNKSQDTLSTPVTISQQYSDAAAEVYTYDATNLDQIIRGDDVLVENGELSIVLSPSSITLLELSSTTNPNDLVSIDIGSQASTVRSIEVNFDGVTVVDPDTFLVEQLDVNGNPVATVDNSYTLEAVEAGMTRATVVFSGPLTEFESLKDGRYRLTVRGDHLEIDGVRPGDDTVEEFYRLFGDRTGDQRVDQADADLLLAALDSVEGDDNFDVAFDFDNDGTIDRSDGQQFVRRARR